MVQDTPSRKLEQYIVRFPDGMRDHLKAEAEKNGRSMNAEIITRLEASLASGIGGGTIDQVFAGTIQRLMERDSLPTKSQLERLTSYYDDFRRTEVQKLREFLDFVAGLSRDDDLLGSYAEQMKNAREGEISALRSHAYDLGFELVARTADKTQD